MVKLKSIALENYCGYRKSEIKFVNPEGEPNNLNILYGPNGEGKSTLLRAITMISNPFELATRQQNVAFRKLTYHPDYDPTYQAIYNSEGLKNQFDLKLDAKFEWKEDSFKNETEERRIILTNEGVIHNELPVQKRGYCFFIDADHPNNMNKFQIPIENAELFLQMAEVVYGYDCELLYETSQPDPKTGKVLKFYTDFVINKARANDITKVYFKRMSDGEKKIATLLRYLCTEDYTGKPSIIVVDNIEMHVYFKRHGKMIDKILRCFPNKQFFMTTHSGTLIDHIRETYGKHCLFNLEDYVRNYDLKSSGSTFF